jgi:hypothetical protein
MDMPPSRYRVVERDRRLIVLDTHDGNRPVVRTPVPPPPAQPRRDSLRPSRPITTDEAAQDLGKAMDAIRAGNADPVFETQRWYDDKAPRRVRLRKQGGNGMGVAIIAILFVVMIGIVSFGWPLLVVAAFLLLQPAARKAFRRSVTRWLDKQEQL